MFGLKKTMLGKVETALTPLYKPLVSVNKNGLVFKRYEIQRDGWIWFVFPRLVVKEIEEIDLAQISARAVKNAQASVAALANASRTEVQDAIKANINGRASRVKEKFVQKIDEIVLGSDELPSAIALKGRAAVKSVHRSFVEAAGAAASLNFEQVIQKTLAQLLTYAREEVGVDSPQERSALPVGTRFVYYGDPITLYIVEEAPRIRTILWDNETVKVSFPYVVLPIYLNNGKFSVMQVFYRNKPLEKQSDSLGAPWLPDIMKDKGEPSELRYKYYLCKGYNKVDKGSPSQVVLSAQKMFWASSFVTNDWHRGLLSDFNRWADFSGAQWINLTKNDPQKILEVAWPDTELTPELLGKDLRKKSGASSPLESITKLDRYAKELSVRLSASVQEAVVSAIADSKGPAEARAIFDAKVREAIAESNLSERAQTFVREELLNVCSGAKADAVIKAVVKKASIKLEQILTPAAAAVISEMTEKFREKE